MSLGLSLAKQLKQLRQSRGRTQEWLAHKLNVARATVNRWETRGAGSVTLDEIEILADALEKPVGEILGILPPPMAAITPGQVPADIAQALARAEPELLELVRDTIRHWERARPPEAPLARKERK